MTSEVERSFDTGFSGEPYCPRTKFKRSQGTGPGSFGGFDVWKH